MAINSASASSQYIRNSAFPIAAPPLAITCWARNNSGGASGAILSIGDAAATKRIQVFQFSGDDQWYINDVAVGSSGGGSAAVAAYRFFLFRLEADWTKHLAILGHDGAVVHITQTAGAGTPTIDTLALGANYSGPDTYFNGQIGEFCAFAAEIQPGGGASSDFLVRQLAYRGPFSVPRHRKDIVEYRRFRSRTILNDTAEVYWRPGTPQPRWTATNAPLGGYPQPPHSANHVTPWGGDRLLPVYELDTIVPPAASGRAQRGGFMVNVGGLMGRF